MLVSELLNEVIGSIPETYKITQEFFMKDWLFVDSAKVIGNETEKVISSPLYPIRPELMTKGKYYAFHTYRLDTSNGMREIASKRAGGEKHNALESFLEIANSSVELIALALIGKWNPEKFNFTDVFSIYILVDRENEVGYIINRQNKIVKLSVKKDKHTFIVPGDYA